MVGNQFRVSVKWASIVGSSLAVYFSSVCTAWRPWALIRQAYGVLMVVVILAIFLLRGKVYTRSNILRRESPQTDAGNSE